MKTILIKTVLAATLFFGIAKNKSYASEPIRVESNSAKIKNAMRLPEYLKMKIVKEDVRVEFCVNEKNEVAIKAIHSNNEEIKNFVAKKFSTLSFDNLKQGENYFVNIVYKVY